MACSFLCNARATATATKRHYTTCRRQPAFLQGSLPVVAVREASSGKCVPVLAD